MYLRRWRSTVLTWAEDSSNEGKRRLMRSWPFSTAEKKTGNSSSKDYSSLAEVGNFGKRALSESASNLTTDMHRATDVPTVRTEQERNCKIKWK